MEQEENKVPATVYMAGGGVCLLLILVILILASF